MHYRQPFAYILFLVFLWLLFPSGLQSNAVTQCLSLSFFTIWPILFRLRFLISLPALVTFFGERWFGATFMHLYTAVSRKVQRKRKAYVTIPKGRMGLSEESVYVLNIHMIKRKMSNDFQRFGNELTAYVKKNNVSFNRIISEKRKKKER